MREYVIVITEILEKKVSVMADNEEAAFKIIKDRYRNEEIVLMPDDCVESSFYRA